MLRLKKPNRQGNFSGIYSVLALKNKKINAMKKFGTIILLTAIIINGYCLNASANIQTIVKTDTIANPENTSVTLGNNAVKIEKGDSSLKMRVGNRGLDVLESLEGRKYDFKKYDNNDDTEVRVGENYNRKDNWDENDDNDHKNFERRRNRFRGHWSGIELGLNNYVTSTNSMVLPDNIDYMTLHSAKSTNFNINFAQLSLGITRHIGFVTGLGLNWNNYRFDGNNNIIKGANGRIEELDPGANLKKSKLATLFMTLPLFLEMQLPVHHNNLSIAAGPIVAMKLSSHTKMVFEDDEKVKSNGDFSLNMMRYGATARVGYGNFMIYGTYYKTPLFQTGKGPDGVDLYPFEIGIALTFQD
jgi:hypothetical protein